MSYININNENKQRLNKRKNTEEYICVLLETQLKRNKKEIVKKYNQYLILNKELWTNNLTKLKAFIDLNNIYIESCVVPNNPSS